MLTDSQMIDWLEAQAKQHSYTGISFDWVPSVEGEPSGFRFMRRRFVGDPKKGLRSAIAEAMNRKDLEESPSPLENIWLRDLDGTGSLHPCHKDDPGAIEYTPVGR